MRSVQAGGQEVGSDRDDQDADQAADQHVRHPCLEARTGIPADQTANAQRDAIVKVRSGLLALAEPGAGRLRTAHLIGASGLRGPSSESRVSATA